MLFSHNSKIENYLSSEEEIIWKGCFKSGGGKGINRRYIPNFRYIVTVIIVWIIGIFVAIGIGNTQIAGVILVCICFLIEFACSFLFTQPNSQTKYAITTKRIFIVHRNQIKPFIYYLSEIRDVSLINGQNNIGTVKFNVKSGGIESLKYGRSIWKLDLEMNAFYGIENPEKVLSILNVAIKEWKKHNKF